VACPLVLFSFIFNTTVNRTFVLLGGLRYNIVLRQIWFILQQMWIEKKYKVTQAAGLYAHQSITVGLSVIKTQARYHAEKIP